MVSSTLLIGARDGVEKNSNEQIRNLKKNILKDGNR
jgi:hypothetical protein